MYGVRTSESAQTPDTPGSRGKTRAPDLRKRGSGALVFPRLPGVSGVWADSLVRTPYIQEPATSTSRRERAAALRSNLSPVAGRLVGGPGAGGGVHPVPVRSDPCRRIASVGGRPRHLGVVDRADPARRPRGLAEPFRG